jgi:hypothetical protein
MLQPKTERQERAIIKNVLSACRDIRTLSKAGYGYLYLASGFIAHYNIHGFIAHYDTPGSLRADILRYADMAGYGERAITDPDHAYYNQKTRIYRALVSELRKLDGAQMVFAG